MVGSLDTRSLIWGMSEYLDVSRKQLPGAELDSRPDGGAAVTSIIAEHDVEPWRRRLYLPAYRIRDAVRYSGVAAQTVTHWHHGDGRLGPALPGHQKRRHLSYLQLVEVAFAATFRMLGVPLQRIRRARAYAALTGKRPETAYTSKEVWAAA